MGGVGIASLPRWGRLELSVAIYQDCVQQTDSLLDLQELGGSVSSRAT